MSGELNREAERYALQVTEVKEADRWVIARSGFLAGARWGVKKAEEHLKELRREFLQDILGAPETREMKG